MTIGETTQATFDQDVQGEIPVLVDFWAPWCGPCLALAPHLETFATDYAGRLKVLKLNIDEAPDGWKHFGVRAIPTLAFYVGGKEYNRLTGPSTMRLRIMIEKWFAERGLALPELPHEPRESNHAQVQTTTPKRWVSFDGDAAIKAAALERLREHATDERYRPSIYLAGDQSFEAVLGIPASFGKLLDSLYDLQSNYSDGRDEAAKDAILALVDAAPVGIDLSTVVAGTFFELLYMSPWAITQHFPKEAFDLLARIRTLHQQEQRGELIAPLEWGTLQRDAVLLATSGLDADMSNDLEALASSLIDGPAAYMTLQLIFTSVKRGYRRCPDWSEAEATQVDAIHQEDADSIREILGDRPEVEGPAQKAWYTQLSELHEIRRAQRRAEQPALWARYDAWQKSFFVDLLEICTHVEANLLSRLRSAAK